MKIDSFEPLQIEALIKQASPDSVRTELNHNGFADYLWTLADGTLEQAERKQCGELIGKIEETEEQLGKELAVLQDKDPNGKMILIVEGVAAPHPSKPGSIQTFMLSQNGKYYRPAKIFKTQYARYESFLIGLERQGILVWRVPSWVETANFLVYMEKSAASFTHTTLQRYVKIQAFHPNPHVKTLMGIANSKGGPSLLGPELAQALIRVFGTPWDVFRADPELIAENTPGIGLVKAKQLLTAIGRTI